MTIWVDLITFNPKQSIYLSAHFITFRWFKSGSNLTSQHIFKYFKPGIHEVASERDVVSEVNCVL